MLYCLIIVAHYSAERLAKDELWGSQINCWSTGYQFWWFAKLHRFTCLYQDINAICLALKAIALVLDVPIWVCSQLARPGKDRTDRRPILNDLQDAGSLEKEADVVLLLHRESYFDPNPKEHETCDVIVAKHRNGPLGTIRLVWIEKCASFANLSAE